MYKILNLSPIVFLFFLSFNMLSQSTTCENLQLALDINSSSYKNCLIEKPGEKFSIDELEKCKKYSLLEMERLSYIFKNICEKM
ncbi:MAG: hypothetical protein CMP24_00955 [Rickettsiales bacterium]|nr:hypothetical protein [Rickettsiales bacterium]|tara:strand:+ start:15 stop:266 length:252 start_codon:yes stop_codon:yes gene_type:complete